MLDPPDSPAVLYTLHTPPREIGRIAQRTGAKMLLLSHLNPTIDAARDAVRASIQASYTGPIEFARDGWRERTAVGQLQRPRRGPSAGCRRREPRSGCRPLGAQSLGNLFRCRHDTQHVFARELGHVGIRPAAAHQPFQQRRISIHAGQPHGRVSNPVEIRAQADMIDARHLLDVIDMVGDLRQRGCRARVFLLPSASAAFARSG